MKMGKRTRTKGKECELGRKVRKEEEWQEEDEKEEEKKEELKE